MIKILVICSLFSLAIYPQKISAIFPEAHFVRIEYSNISKTGRALSSSYLFEIKFSLKLSGKDFTWDKPIGLIYTTSNSSERLIILNKECRILESNQLYSYSFLFSTRNRCSLDFNLGELDSENKSIISSYKVRFTGNSVYLDIRNKK